LILSKAGGVSIGCLVGGYILEVGGRELYRRGVLERVFGGVWVVVDKWLISLYTQENNKD